MAAISGFLTAYLKIQDGGQTIELREHPVNQLLGVSSELVSSGDSSTKPQLKDLFTPSSPPIWTIVTPSLLASLFLIFLHSSVFKIQQLEWLL